MENINFVFLYLLSAINLPIFYYKTYIEDVF